MKEIQVEIVLKYLNKQINNSAKELLNGENDLAKWLINSLKLFKKQLITHIVMEINKKDNVEQKNKEIEKLLDESKDILDIAKISLQSKN